MAAVIIVVIEVSEIAVVVVVLVVVVQRDALFCAVSEHKSGWS